MLGGILTRNRVNSLLVFLSYRLFVLNTQGDSDVISTLAGFRRHLVGKTLINVFFSVISLKYALLAS